MKDQKHNQQRRARAVRVASPFSGLEWEDAAPVAAYALAGEDAVGMFVRSSDVRRVLELFGCSEASRVVGEDHTGVLGVDDEGFTITDATYAFVSEKLGGDLDSSLALIAQRWREEQRMSEVLTYMSMKGTKDISTLNESLKVFEQEPTSRDELQRYEKKGYCKLGLDDSVALTESGAQYAEGSLPPSNCKQGTCERGLKREREENEKAEPSIASVVTLAEEREEDARAKKDKVNKWHKIWKTTCEKFVEDFADDEGMQETRESVLKVVASTEVSLEKAQCELEGVLTAKRLAYELEGRQLAIDTETRRLHQQLAKK